MEVGQTVVILNPILTVLHSVLKRDLTMFMILQVGLHAEEIVQHVDSVGKMCKSFDFSTLQSLPSALRLHVPLAITRHRSRIVILAILY